MNLVCDYIKSAATSHSQLTKNFGMEEHVLRDMPPCSEIPGEPDSLDKNGFAFVNQAAVLQGDERLGGATVRVLAHDCALAAEADKTAIAAFRARQPSPAHPSISVSPASASGAHLRPCGGAIWLCQSGGPSRTVIS